MFSYFQTACFFYFLDDVVRPDVLLLHGEHVYGESIIIKQLSQIDVSL